MEIKLTGKLHTVLPLRSGTSGNGNWQAQKFVIKKDNGEYLSITAKGKKVEDIPTTMGKDLTVVFNPISKENKGNWYDENVLIKVEY